MKTILIIFNLILFAGNSFAAEMLAKQQAMKKKRIKQQALQQGALQGQSQQQVRTQEAVQRRRQISPASAMSRVSASRYGYEEEIVDIEEVWFALETSSEIWIRIIDSQPKKATVEMYINWYEDRGIHIQKTVSEYVSIIDNMVSQNPSILSNPFRDILKVVAIIEYDFDNGQNKDIMAKKILGEAAYQRNKNRLGR